MRPIFVIGNPTNRRVTFFQQALAAAGLPAATVLSYFDLLTNRQSLEELIAPGSTVRIDSPGEDFSVEKLLLREGFAAATAEGSPAIDDNTIDQLELDRGLIQSPRQWYLGFCEVLRRWQNQLDAIPDVVCLSSPREIAVMFDKRQCHTLFASANIPIPASWGEIRGYEQFIQTANDRSSNRAFVKLAHGSSASGVVAWRRQGTRQVAITSAELVRNGRELRLYNSLKIRRYTDSRDIADLIDTLARERLHVENWFSKGSVEPGRCFDLRVVTIAGEPQHTVVRQSASPMTNLHLGNARGSLERVRVKLGADRMNQVLETCRQTAGLFPNSLMVGLDVAINTGFSKHVVFEANAFGDLLPGALHQGVDTYAAQVNAIFPRQTLQG
jgi:hypothetical protein